MSVTTRLNSYMVKCMTGTLDDSIDPKVTKAVKRIYGKAGKYLSDHGFNKLPDAYFTVLDALLKGEVSPGNADAFLKWLLDGGEPAKWEGSH